MADDDIDPEPGPEEDVPLEDVPAGGEPANTARPRRSAVARGWSPAAAGLTGALLLVLVLPSPLRLPQQPPSASAEYAPVPGEPERGQNANFARTDAPGTPTYGPPSNGGNFPNPGPRPLPVYRARHKECVGDPPRQTEDPLSPPCVPFFDGDNGGATFPGVTKDLITVVIYNDSCCDGDMTQPWDPSDEAGCTADAPWECQHIVRTIKMDLRHFQRRYQTYGRTVRLIAQKSGRGEVGSTCAERQQDARRTITQHAPFAVVSFAQGNQHCYLRELASQRIPLLGLGEDIPEHIYETFRPYSYGFMPSQEVQAAWSASFICQKLANGPARHTSDPLLAGQQRSFGLIEPESAEVYDAERVQMARILKAELKQRCGLEPLVRSYDNDQDWPTLISLFKQRGITTVICQCITGRAVGIRTATAQSYFPEWYWDQATYMDRAFWARAEGAAEQPAFGTTYFWRTDSFRSQFHYQAYLQEAPGTQPNVFWSYRIYHLMLNLFQGIQAAGPFLTPETIEQGMFTFNYLQRDNPWAPTGGYGPYGSNAISNYTFVDTAMAWWWDPDGVPPGEPSVQGCMRAVRGGLRSYPGEWPTTDKDLFDPGDPCTQDLYKVADPSAAGAP